MMDPRHPGIIGAHVPLDLAVFPASSGLLLGLCEVGAPSSLRLSSIPGSIVWHFLGPLLSLLRCWGRRLACPGDNQSEAPDWLAPGLQSAPLLSASEVLPLHQPSPVFFPGAQPLLLLASWVAEGYFWFMDLWISTVAVPAASMSAWIWGLLATVRPRSFLLDGLLVTLSSFSISGHHLPQQVHSPCGLFHLLWHFARPNAADLQDHLALRPVWSSSGFLPWQSLEYDLLHLLTLTSSAASICVIWTGFSLLDVHSSAVWSSHFFRAALSILTQGDSCILHLLRCSPASLPPG